MMRNTSQTWGGAAKIMHWTIALLVLVQMVLGWTAVAWHLSPTKLDLFVLHKSTGMLILMLMVVRLCWRWTNVTPDLPRSMAAWERVSASASHFALYLLLFIAPVTGWIINSAANVPFRAYWLIPIHSSAEANKGTADITARIHFVIAVALSLVLIVHIAAALRHQFLIRDNVLTRMLPDSGRLK